MIATKRRRRARRRWHWTPTGNRVRYLGGLILTVFVCPWGGWSWSIRDIGTDTVRFSQKTYSTLGVAARECNRALKEVAHDH